VEKIKISLNKEALLNCILPNINSLDSKKDDNEGIFSSLEINIRKDSIYFVSYNSEYVVKSTEPVSLNLEEPFTTVVSGKIFFNAVNNIKEETVNIEFDEQKLKIKGDKKKYELVYKPKTEFPKISAEINNPIDIEEFKKILSKSLFCTGKDKYTPIINTVWFGEKLTLAGDGLRFSSLANNLPIKNVAICTRTLEEILNSISLVEDPSLTYSYDGSSKVYFKINDKYTFESTLITQRYPKEIASNIKEYKNKITCNTKDFLETVQNFSSFLNNITNTLNIEVVEDKINLSIATESCKGEEQIDIINKEGFTVKTLFKCNYKFILDILKEIKDNDTFILEVSDELNVCNIKTNIIDFVHPIALKISNQKE
jgi:DNA polymerase-3 subunit beta